jgi:hypothetical protein
MNRKGDMNFWLVLGVLALIFMFVVFFVMTGIIGDFAESAGNIQDEADKQAQTIDFDFGGDDDDESAEDVPNE